MRMASVAGVALMALALGGCGGSEVVRSVNVSVGQQLIDLKKARDSGALSAREYESQKAQLIKGVE
jgi:hypothetical protein